MKANRTLLQMKYARIIPLFAEKVGINTKQALDFFYHSVEYQLLREGVSDLHCMDEDYIAEDLADEWREKIQAMKKEEIVRVEGTGHKVRWSLVDK